MDETGEFKTTTKLRLLYPEPAKPDRNAPVAFLAKRNTWTPFDDVITVGRATVHDLSLPYDSVSKFHACLTRWPKGWKITDERAVNGTFVDRKQLATGSATPIQDGARIGFGPEVEVLFFTPEGLYRFLAAYREESRS